MTFCGAHKRHGGGTCKRPAGWGTSHPGVGACKNHGGSTPTHEQHARKEIARREITRLGLELGEQPGKIDPREVLALELWRTHINVSVLEHLVGQLSLNDGGIYAGTFHASGERTGEAKPHVLVVMYETERKHLALVAVAAAKAGVEERRVELEAERGELIAEVFRRMIDDLKLPAAKREEAMVTAARHLRALPGGRA